MIELVRSGQVGGQIPLSGFDIVGGHQFSWHTYLYQKLPSIDSIKAGLISAIKEVPVFAGRMKSRSGQALYIDCNDAGIPFTVVDRDIAMPSYGMHKSVDVDFQHYIDAPPRKIVDKDEPLFRIKITRFSCGGAIIGLIWTHSLVDGAGYMNFISRWARSSRVSPPLPPPQLDRNAITSLREGTTNEPSEVSTLIKLSFFTAINFGLRAIWRSKFTSAHHMFLLDKTQFNQLRDLKNSETKLSTSNWVSTHDLLCAFMWKCVAEVQTANGNVKLGLVKSIRGAEGLGISEHYIGNANMLSFIDYDFSQLRDDSITDVAIKIRNETKKINPINIRKEITYMATIMDKENANLFDGGLLDVFNNNGFLYNNLSQFPIHELDFGTGIPLWIDGPSRKRAPRYLAVCPTGRNDGSLVIHLILPKSEMSLFKDRYGTGSPLDNRQALNFSWWPKHSQPQNPAATALQS